MNYSPEFTEIVLNDVVRPFFRKHEIRKTPPSGRDHRSFSVRNSVLTDHRTQHSVDKISTVANVKTCHIFILRCQRLDPPRTDVSHEQLSVPGNSLRKERYTAGVLKPTYITNDWPVLERSLFHNPKRCKFG